MAEVIRVKTVVLPGGRVQVAAPGLPIGLPVEVVVSVAETVPTSTNTNTPQMGIADFLKSLPPGPRSADSWEEFERLFQEERDSWD